MGFRRVHLAFVLAGLWACSGRPAPDEGPAAFAGVQVSLPQGPTDTGTPPVTTPPDAGGPTDPNDPGDPTPPDGGTPQKLVFQPAFHQAIRWSTSLSDVTTFRMKIPLGRSAQRVKVTFRAGDGALRIVRAFIGLAGTGGAFQGTPVPLTFNGEPGATLTQAREAVQSDPAPLTAKFHDDVYVSVVLQGEPAASAIEQFPDSYCYPGDQADAAAPQGGSDCKTAMAIQTIETEAPPSREFLALGDSITEEYMDSGPPDFRKSWPSVLEGLLGVPVLNSAVSGQGVDGPLMYFDNDVTSVAGVTDCVVLLGTNDLLAYPTQTLEQHMTMLYDALRPVCRLWIATLTPRERVASGSITTAQEVLREINTWLRNRGEDELIDLNAVTRDPTAPDSWLAPYEGDGVHPTYLGASAMAHEAARVIQSEVPVPSPQARQGL